MAITVKQANHTLEAEGNYTLPGTHTTPVSIENNLRTQNLVSHTYEGTSGAPKDIEPSNGDVFTKVKAVGLPLITDTIELALTNILGQVTTGLSLSEGDTLEGPFTKVTIEGTVSGGAGVGKIQTWEKV